MLDQELFVFVTEAAVDGTNNAAERELRDDAAARKTGRTSKTAAGTKRRSVVSSVLQSIGKQLGNFTLQSVIEEANRWLEVGRSCFAEQIEGAWFKSTESRPNRLSQDKVSSTESFCSRIHPLTQSPTSPRALAPIMLRTLWTATENAISVDEYTKQLGKRLRRWLATFPPGLGFATFKACLRLWLGYSPETSGVFSAGNGPAMRAAILGVTLQNLAQLRQLIRRTSRVTHTDPKAEYGAYAIALAAHMSGKTPISQTIDAEDYLRVLSDELGDEASECLNLVEQAINSAARNETVQTFADSIGQTKGVSGYVYHTVPIAIQAWLRYQNDFALAITETIYCGGDTDSTAAIVGGLLGSRVGREQLPKVWLDRLIEWPGTVAWMDQLVAQFVETVSQSLESNDTTPQPIDLPYWGLLPRNLLFLSLVVMHALRRYLPPY